MRFDGLGLGRVAFDVGQVLVQELYPVGPLTAAEEAGVEQRRIRHHHPAIIDDLVIVKLNRKHATQHVTRHTQHDTRNTTRHTS